MATSSIAQLLFLFSTAPLVLSSPTGLSDLLPAPLRNLTFGLKPRVDDKYPWAALGDSFSAGPGAGTAFGDHANDCYRNDGAYPAQLNKDFPYPGNAMQFLSCTAAVVDDMISLQIPNMDADQQLITLSIGGNDVKFGKILRACVFKPAGPASDDCDETLKTAHEFVDNLHDGFAAKLTKAYEAVFAKMLPGDARKVLVQLYPNFFNEKTDWCDKQTMGVIPYYKPLLTKDLRRKLNFLGDKVRDRMKKTIEDFAHAPHNPHWFRNRIYFMDEFDYDTYPGHRFCEPGVEKFDDPNVWFFTVGGSDSPTVKATDLMPRYDPATCAKDPKYETDFAFGWYCDTVRYASSQGVSSKDVVTYAPETIIKAFHPKTIAFTSIKNQHKETISRLVPPREIHIDSGNLQCFPTQADGDAKYYASREDMTQAMSDFCAATAKAGITLGSNEGVFKGIHVSAKHQDNCKPSLDASAAGFEDLCKARMINAIDGCDVGKRSSNLWKQGGSFFRDCMTWYISKTPVESPINVSAGNSTRAKRAVYTSYAVAPSVAPTWPQPAPVETRPASPVTSVRY